MNKNSFLIHEEFIGTGHVTSMNCSKLLLLAAWAIPVSLSPATGHAAAPVPPPAVAGSTSGRLLSSSCFQCHASSGFEGVTGKSPSEIVSELQEMKARRVPEGIMDLVARGLTDTQIREIATYLATLPPTGNDD